MKIKELLIDESKWIKGKYATMNDGEGCSIFHDKATCFCLDGAITKCYPPSQRNNIYQKIVNELNPGIINHIAFSDGAIIAWNDAPERNFNDIKNLIEKLDI